MVACIVYAAGMPTPRDEALTANSHAPRGGLSSFATTHWSVVLAAGQPEHPQAPAALDRLCCAYWYPLYVFVRRQGNSPEDAQDLTQAFFSRFLEKNYVARANPERGRFRTFLLQSLKHFLVNEWKRASRLKRGGGVEFLRVDGDLAEIRYSRELAGEANPDAAYEQRWAVTLLERVLDTLRLEYHAGERARLFERLKAFIWGEQTTSSYAQIASELSLSEGAVKVAVYRLRQRFRDVLRAEVAPTVARPEDIDGELRHLIAVLS